MKKVTRYVNAQIRATSALVDSDGTRRGFLYLKRDGFKGFVIPKIADGLCLDIIVDNESVKLVQQSEDPFVNCVLNQISPDLYRQICLQYGNFSGRAGYVLREKFGNDFVKKIIVTGSYWYFMRILLMHPREWGEQSSKTEPLAEGEQHIGINSKLWDPYGRVRTKGRDYSDTRTQKIGNFDK